MQCLVSYIQWSHQMINGKIMFYLEYFLKTIFTPGTEKVIKTNSNEGDPYNLVIQVKGQNNRPPGNKFYTFCSCSLCWQFNKLINFFLRIFASSPSHATLMTNVSPNQFYLAPGRGGGWRGILLVHGREHTRRDGQPAIMGLATLYYLIKCSSLTFQMLKNLATFVF